MVIPGPNQLNQGLPYLLGDQWLSTLVHPTSISTMLDCSFLHDLESYSKQETAAGAKLLQVLLCHAC